jgi:dolichyl-diphosphooligosaccharide--protein glycosyltransferase
MLFQDIPRKRKTRPAVKNNKFIAVVCAAAVIGLNIYFRCYPSWFPRLKAEAKTRAEYAERKAEWQDEKGRTYLLELDGWNWARYVENVVRSGRPGDVIADDRNRDMLTLHPQGADLPWAGFLFYAPAWVYETVPGVRSIPLMTFLFYLPLLFLAVFLMVLYAFAYRLGKNLGAVISCLFVGLAPVFLWRSSAGRFDTDILNLLFPLLAVWAYVKTMDGPSFRLKAAWAFLASFWVGLFAFSWIGWWFIACVILLYEAYGLLDRAARRVQFKESAFRWIRERLAIAALFSIGAGVWVTFFSGGAPWRALLAQFREFLKLNVPLSASMWPNVLSTVEELLKTDTRGFVHATGGFLQVLPGLVCMLALLWTSKKFQGFQQGASFALALWFGVIFAIRGQGARFAMFLLPPLGLFLGWGLAELFQRSRRTKKTWLTAGAAILAIAVGAKAVSNGDRTARMIYPDMNDAWHGLLTDIRDKTPPGSVINTWWDFGSWFKTVAGRPVIFDGQSQNTPQAYWMARALIADDEDEALGILRMLNNGGNQAFEVVDGALRDPLRSILLLKRLLVSSPDGRRELAVSALPQAAAEEVMKLISAKPGPAFFIVDETMAEKMEAVISIGNWDFTKVFIVQNATGKNEKRILEDLRRAGLDGAAADKLYREFLSIPKKERNAWIAPGKDLSKSLFVRLFFQTGKDLRHFKPFLRAQRGKTRIEVFQILWDEK